MEEKTGGLFPLALESICCMATACMVSSTQIDIAPESESDDDQPTDFEAFKNKVKKKLAEHDQPTDFEGLKNKVKKKLAGDTSQEKPDVTVKDDVSDDEVFVID